MKRKILSLVTSISFLSMTLSSVSSSDKIFAASELSSEIMSMRSQYEKHFENEDGSISAFVDSVPVHYFDNGNWYDIDNTLTISSDGNYTNKSNSINVTLASHGCADSINEIDDVPLISIDYDNYKISWDFVSVDTNYLNSDVPISINDYEYQRKIDMGNDNITKSLEQSLKKTISSASYKSMFDNIDVNIELRSNTVKENIVINNKEAAETPITYYLMAEGTTPKVNDNNSISFINSIGEVIYSIPSPYMFDSTKNGERNFNIKINFEKYENGYLISYILDKAWLESDERMYPVIVDPVVEINNSITTSTISEASPNSYITGDLLKIGGVQGNRFAALVSLPGPAVNYNDRITITDAKLYMFFSENYSLGSDSRIKVSSINNSYMPYWSNIYSQNATLVDKRAINVPGLLFFDVTKIINAWRNYVRTGGKVGVYSYVLKLEAEDLNSRIYTADSHSDMHPPYYRLTYTMDTDYTFTYSPTKYDDFENVKNFKNKMNCYAYALQIFENNNGGTDHNLIPGALDLQNNPNFNSYTALKNHYSGITSISAFESFVDQQMRVDSNSIGLNINQFYIPNNYFSLPSSYNQSNQRVIAMQVGNRYTTYQNGYIPTPRFDFHFYVRHGNGSCTVHGGTCSKWSHKMGYDSVSDEINGTILCDANIAALTQVVDVGTTYVRTRFSQPVRYYTIQKNANVYSSWYNYNNSDTLSYLG